MSGDSRGEVAQISRDKSQEQDAATLGPQRRVDNALYGP
jgi:hypothetical protein